LNVRGTRIPDTERVGIIIYQGCDGTFGELARKGTETTSGSDKLRKTLLSVGADKGSVDKLVSSKTLNDIVIPIYWKDGLVSSSRPFSLVKLPEFMKSFEKEFPDGQVRWDQDYESNDAASGDIALRVYFNYQEDDQGDHWSPPPTLLEEESYYRMLASGEFKGKKSVSASKVVHGR
jgi:hypothetical protein